MKAIAASILFAGSSMAHSAVRHIVLDGVRYAARALSGAILICDSYPARDARMDYNFGSKRIEWNYKNMNNFPWMAVTDVSIPAITYK